MVKDLNNNLSGYVSNWSYFALNGDSEHYTTAGCTYKEGKACFSLGAGIDTNICKNDVRISPTVEGKVNFDLGKGFTAQARGRCYGGKDKNPVFQARGTLTKKFETPVKNLTPYVAAHITDKMCANGHKVTTGGWIGVSYNIKNLTFSAEFQQNIPLNNTFQGNDNSMRMLNVGISGKF